MKNSESATIVIGITGGIGSGKTTVSKIIAEEGYIVISTDDKAKEMMTDNFEVMKKIIDEFGVEAYLPDGSLNSAFLSNLVFGADEVSARNLEKLNAIVHPPVIDFMIEEVKKYEEVGEPLVFIESALIYEAGLDEGFDYIIVVDTDEEFSVGRVAERTGMTHDEVKMRISMQMPREEKKRLADFAIENNGTHDEIVQSVKSLLNIIKYLKPPERD
jgi:dephospho-CoA kinase